MEKSNCFLREDGVVIEVTNAESGLVRLTEHDRDDPDYTSWLEQVAPQPEPTTALQVNKDETQ